MSSCAIHKDFPYICLRWGCFAKQVGLPDSRVIKKQMEVNAKVRKRKRENKRKKNTKIDAISKSTKNYTKEEAAKEVESTNKQVRKDTIINTFSPNGYQNYLILVFKEAHPPGKDSLLIKYPEKGDVISDYEKARIKNYLSENKISSGDKIIVKEYKEYTNPELGEKNNVKNKLAEFLESLGISLKQIRFKE